jgi:predicted peptidase
MKAQLKKSLFVLVTVCLSTMAGDVHTLDATRQKSVKALNPEFLVYMPRLLVAEKLPMLIYLHGAGGVGNKVGKLEGQSRALREGLSRMGKQPCIVVVPQSLRRSRGEEAGGWLPGDLDVLMDQLMTTLPVDEKRIYLTGNSMGGYGCWVWAGNSPQHFAAIAPISGGIGPGGPKDVTPDLDAWAANLAKVPVWAFAGGKDRVVPAERSERMLKAIQKAGGTQAKLTVHPEEGHNARQLVFVAKDYYDWMFAQKRD